jgi:enoyl-CoA hydratase/carnithine racemase
MTEPLVLYQKLGPVARLTLNRPSALNAVNLAMRDELWVLLHAVRDDPDVRAVIIRGAGERAFCAGADVKEFGTAPSLVEARRARRERDLWGLMASLPKPLVAAIHGWALGAGCEMSLLCDLRIAAEDARMGLPEVTLGYIPSAGGTQTLPRVIAPGVAMHMILSGESIGAADALRVGLVHRVVARPKLDAEAETLAARLAELPPDYTAAVKQVVCSGLDLPLFQALDREVDAVSHLLRSAHARASLAGRAGS